MQRILMSLVAIVAVAAVAGVSSYALWSDTESADGNYIEAGSLDLKVDGNDLDGSAAIEVSGVAPGVSDSMTGEVENVGTIDGTLYLSFDNVSSDENVLIEPEAEDNDTTETEGELCDELIVEVYYDGSLYGAGTLQELADLSPHDLGTLAPFTPTTYGLSAEVDPNADNTIMTDKCMFDIVAELSQEVAPS
jgi:predicted ribosomally synthesized peptide with SipW-like signal peptide